ncbi:MAG: hypothetical protein AB8C13_03650 [Phycisphaerales bacterium]
MLNESTRLMFLNELANREMNISPQSGAKMSILSALVIEGSLVLRITYIDEETECQK